MVCSVVSWATDSHSLVSRLGFSMGLPIISLMKAPPSAIPGRKHGRSDCLRPGNQPSFYRINDEPEGPEQRATKTNYDCPSAPVGADIFLVLLSRRSVVCFRISGGRHQSPTKNGTGISCPRPRMGAGAAIIMDDGWRRQERQFR